jgi:hypothetical protein
MPAGRGLSGSYAASVYAVYTTMGDGGHWGTGARRMWYTEGIRNPADRAGNGFTEPVAGIR